jgi:aspartate aminotransferase
MRDEFDARRQLVSARLNAIPGLKLHPPGGAFYAFFDVSSYFNDSIQDSAAFCSAALAEAHVNLVQGSAFGCEGYVRMSFAAARAELEAGLDALADWLKSR